MTVSLTHKPVNSQKQFLALVNDDEQIVVHSVVSMHGCYTAVHVFVPRGEQHIHYAAAVRRKALQQESVLSHQLVASNTYTHLNCLLPLDAEGGILRINENYSYSWMT